MFKGLIFTDTERLAKVLSCSKRELNDVLSSYISGCSSYIQWYLVDVSDAMYGYMDPSDWCAYASVLNDYYYGMGLQGVYNTPLFILGGQEIIPMPPVESPFSSVGGEYLLSDMIYSFDLQAHTFLEEVVSTHPRFGVGRLPLTSEWDVESLQSYLDDCIDYAANGISIRGAVMTTTQSWLRASKEMMRDIPAVSVSTDYVPVNERMIVSPDLDIRDREWYDGYVHELKKVDFLVCNLHGSDAPGTPCFFGEDTSRRSYPMAVDPSMMIQTTPIIFNTVACFGGRYIGYDLDDSMLLKSMAYGTMLYCGSCETALGGNNKEGYSELLMTLYVIYLHQGMPAGMAMMKAKQDYYRTCHDVEGDDAAMFTILEFNLYGCPILSMQPKLSANYKPELLGRRIAEKETHVTYRPKEIGPLEQSAYQADDIHAYVRGLVDNNLSVIRQKVEKEVYQRLGLGADKLKQVMRMSQDATPVGYRFVYGLTAEKQVGLKMYYFIHTDNQGEITQIIHTK